MISEIAEKFIGKVGNHELYPPFNNVSLFTSHWNTEQFWNEWFDDKTSLSSLIIKDEDIQVLYCDNTKFEKITREIFTKYFKDEVKFNGLLEKFNRLFEEIQEMYNLLDYDTISKMTEGELLNNAQKAISTAWHLETFSFFSVTFEKDICENLIQEIGIQIRTDRLNDVWEKMIIPVVNSFDKRRIILLGEMIKNDIPRIKVLEKCQFFRAGFMGAFSLKHIDDIIEKEYDFLSNKNAAEIIKKIDQERDARAANYKKWSAALSPDEKKLADFVQLTYKLRDLRKDFVAQGSVIYYRIAQKIFSDAKISEGLIPYCTYQEFIKGSDYIKSISEELIQRKSGVAVITSYNGEIEVVRCDIKEIKRYMDGLYLKNDEKSTDNISVKGKTGSPGKIKGIVRIVINAERDGKKINQGDILVTGMTRPEFVPLMKRAGAFVTDEGGITCHAAIVAREMKKPCVISTRIATQFLKDGDMVEVDADKGTVTKIF